MAVEQLENRVTPDVTPGDEYLGLSKKVYGPNEPIDIDVGKITFVGRGTAGIGIEDGPGAIVADIYIVPVGSEFGALHDVSGSPNTVVGSILGGGFLLEQIGFTRPFGGVPPGEYSVVYDENQNGEFDIGIDAAFERAFKVNGQPYVPPPGWIVRKKDEWRAAADATELDNPQLKSAFDLLRSGRFSRDILTFHANDPGGDNRAAIGYFKQMLGLALDPPDPDFRQLSPVTAGGQSEPSDNDRLVNGIRQVDENLRLAAAIAEALLHSMERYQGAQEATDVEWALIQGRAVRDNLARLREQMGRMNAALAGLRDAILSDPRDLEAAVAGLADLAERVATSGFTADELREFRNLGLSDAAVSNLRNRIAGRHPLTFSRTAIASHIDNWIDANENSAAGDVAAEAEMEGVVRFLESEDFVAPQLAPVADAGGPYAAAEGVSVMLDGTRSADPNGAVVAWDWDLDLDGQFDDATGSRPAVTFAQAFDGYVGLRVTDNTGRTGIAYARTTVADTNARPVITAFSPTAGFQSVTLGGQLPLAVTATDADPVTATWFVDGVAAGGGPTFAYAPTLMSQIGVHLIRAEVSDNNPSGGRAVQEWTVAVYAPDADGDGWTANIDLLDNDPNVNPGRPEVIGNGLDDDCNPDTPDYGRLDLVVAQVATAGLTTDPQTLEATGSVAVTVTNRGADSLLGGVVGPVKVLLFEDRNADGNYQPAADNFLGTATLTTDIAAGGSATITVPVHTILLFRDNVLGAVVDPDNTVPEVIPGGEANNAGDSGQASRYQPTADWLPLVQWQWTMPPTGFAAGPGALATVAPLVDTNGDGLINARDVPAVVVNTTSNGSDGTIRLTALRGDTGAVIFSAVNPVPARSVYAFSAPTVADLDGDGRPEILLSAIAVNILYCFNNDGTLKWQSQRGSAGFWNTYPVPVDLDGDGKSEVLYGTAALNFDGTVRWDTGRSPVNGVGDLGGVGNFAARQAADLNLDGVPEVVAGRSVLDRNGQPLWAWQTAFNPANGRWVAQRSVNGGPWVSQFESDIFLADGFAAVANLDADPNPEIVVVSPQRFGAATGTGPALWVFNHDGSLYEPPVPLAQDVFNGVVHYAGPPTVADFDGDGRPEVAVPVTNNVSASAAGSFADPERVTLYVLGADGAEVWHKGLTPTGAGNPYIPPPTAFDFDGDGAVELVVQDQQYLYVLDGRTGATRFQFAVGNEANVITSMAPVVADVDNDGAAEVVTFATQSFGVGSPPRQGIVVIGDANDNWVHARRNWNQWLYNPAFTDENGSVPVHARNGWEVQNGVRTQVPIEGVDRFAAPDLSVSRVTVDGSNCPASAGVIARIGNGGSLQAGAGIRVAFYLGDPAAGGTLLGVRTTSRPLFPGEFEDVRFDWAAPTVGPIYVTANDPPPAARVASANLALLPDAWARSSGFLGDSTVPMNRNAYLGIDGNGNTQWTPAGGTDTDPGPHFFEVRFPFPVEVTGVAVQNQGGGATGLLGSATLTFSNGYATTIDLGTTGAGSVTVPEQTGITWVKLTASSVAAGGPGLSEFVVAGSYVPPSFLTNEGVGKRGNNVAAAGFIGVPCDPAADFTPTVFAGADRVIAEGGTLALSPAMFTDPGLLAAHAATIDWGDGSPVGVGAVTEAGGSGTVAGSHVYRRGGASTVTVHVTDPAGHVGRGTFTVLVQNLPAAVTAGPDRVAAEGQSVTLSAAFADPGVLDTHAATIDWGDGTVEAGVVAEAGGSGTVAGAHAYRDNGRYTVTVTVTDDGGAAAAARFAVQVAGQAPVVEAGSDGSIDEGGRFALAGAGFADAGLADTHTVRIDWGDGTPYGVGVVSGGPAGATVHADHVYEDGGTFTVTVVVTDDDGAVGSDTCQVVVANVAPTVNAGPDRDVAATVTLPPAWFSDPSVLDTHAATVDWGDGTAGSGSVFQWRGSGTVGGSHTYLADGAYTVTITVADDDGGRGQASFHVTAHVLNQPPAVLTEGAVTVFEGDSREFAFAFTDPNPDGAHTAALDWADGSPAGAVPLANDLGGFGTAFATHRFLDDGTFDAAFTVTDDGHLSGTGLTRVVVANRPPVVDAGADRSTGVGALLSLPAVFTDAGVLDAHVASIAWGDGSVTPAAILEANGAGTAAGQHAYAAPGTYTVVVTVTDDDGGVGSDTLLVTVFNTPPAADAGPDRAVREGDAVMLTGAFTDPDAGDPPTFRWHVVASNGQAIADGTGPTFAFTPNDNGTYTATFTVTDAAGAAASDSVVVAVANAAPSPAVGGTPATGPEGTAVALIASVSDPGAADTHTFAWAVTKNGAAFASGGGAAFGFTPDDNGTYVVTLTATDDDGAIGTDGRTIVVTNAAPTVDAGPDASVAAGAAFTRAGSFTDPGTADTFTATVDYGDGTGGQGLPLAGTAFTLAHTYAAPGTYTVTVTVTDDDGAGNTDTVQVAVTGGAQLTAAIAGPADAVRGQPRTFILTAADGSGDPTVVYNFALDWDGNGTTDQTVVGPSGTTVDHAFPAVGTFTVRMTADRSGRTATAAHAMRVTAAALQPDPCCGGTALVVGGTPCDDTIVIAPACGTGAVGVWVGCAWLGTFHPTGRVIVYAQAGNDNVQVAGGVDHPAWLYGGAGDDRLKGGGGHNVLLGGVGEDLLVGGNDRDVLIGGTGADRLVGNAADDILVAGSTAFDDDEDGLCAVLAEWSSARPYAARLANIRGTGSGSGFANRLNGNFFLQVTSAAATTTVFDDGAADVLTGASGQDWFLANVSGGGVRDRVTDLSAAEFLTDLDFILGP